MAFESFSWLQSSGRDATSVVLNASSTARNSSADPRAYVITTMDLDAIYSSHPLRAETILARLGRAGTDLKRLTELQLAVDPETELTDQNHSGGMQSVLELALAAGVTAASTVVDIGCGLGGSARVLAAEFGCRVIGIERDIARCRDARRLTSLVHLDHLVSIQQADALAGDVRLRDADVIWGQGAWIHFP